MHTSPIPGAIQEPTNHRQLFEEAAVAIHEIDTGGIIRVVNQAECQLLGYLSQELIGRHISEFVAAEHQQAARDAISRKIAREEPVTIFTREYRRRDGNYIWLEIHEKLIESAEGEVVGIRSALLDITERYHFDTRIQKRFDWMRFVLDSIATAIVTADALGNVDFMNPAAEAITGWPQQHALGHPLEQVCRLERDSGEPVELMSCILAESVISKPSRKFVIVDRIGASHRVSWTISPVCNDSGVIIGAALVIEKQ
jgi:PAS domain S-box-containing protein